MSSEIGITMDRPMMRLTAVAAVVLGALGLISGSPEIWVGMLATLGCHVPVLFGAWCVVGKMTGRRPDRTVSARELVLTGQVYFLSLMALGLVLGNLGLLNRQAAFWCAAAMGLVMIRHGRGFGCPPREGIGGTRLERVSRILLWTGIGFALWCALVEPSYSYDVLTYHLFFPARWIQDGAISIVPTWFGDPAPAYAPSAAEVYYAWLMLPMGGDFLARGGQFAFWVLLICAVYGIAGEMGVNSTGRAVVAGSVGAIPAIFGQAQSAMVDVALAAHLVTMAMFSLRVGRRRRGPDLMGLAMSGCLLVGTKFIGIAYLVGMAPLVLWAARRAPGLRVRTGGTEKGCGRPACMLLILAGVWSGGYWYVRNWVVTGNVIYPMTVRIGEREVFEGAYGREQMENSAFNVRRRHEPDAFDRTMWTAFHGPEALPSAREGAGITTYPHWYLGPAGLIAGLFLSSLSWAAWKCIRAIVLGRGPLDSRSVRALVFGVSAAGMFAIFWFLLPFQQARFAWGPIVLILLCGTGILRPFRRAAIPLFFLSAAAYVFFFRNEGIRAPAGGGWAAAGFLLMAAAWVTRLRHDTIARSLPVWSIVLLFAVVLLASSSSDDARSRTMSLPRWQTQGEAWKWVDQHLHGARIAYVGNNVPYFLCGRNLENRVFYVPARRAARGRFHDFSRLPETEALGPPNTSEPACDRYVMDPREWLNNLRALGVEYAFVSALFPGLLPNYRHDREGFTIEREWLDRLCQVDANSQSVTMQDGGGSGPVAQCRVFAPGSVRLYRLNLGGGVPGEAALRGVVQDETDALDRLWKDGLPPGAAIPDYPLARRVLDQAGLHPLVGVRGGG